LTCPAPFGEPARKQLHPAKPSGAKQARGNRRSTSALAVHHQLVSGKLSQSLLEFSQRNVHRTGYVAGVPFRFGPDVHNDVILLAIGQVRNGYGRELLK
jgi:hypothetical protein